jgi:DNA-binding NarL/FixJ family response regulator
LIRVAILADSLSRAHRLAELLSEEERIEVLDPTISQALDHDHALLVDVILAAALPTDQVPTAGPPLVVLSEDLEASPDEPLIRALLPLNAAASEIVAAIIAAASDLTVLTKAQARRWFRDTAPRQDGALVETLTPRELQVLRTLADGLSNKEIAARLGISDHTAKFHVTQILGKLGAASRTEAVATGIRRGLVPI